MKIHIEDLCQTNMNRQILWEVSLLRYLLKYSRSLVEYYKVISIQQTVEGGLSLPSPSLGIVDHPTGTSIHYEPCCPKSFPHLTRTWSETLKWV